MHKIDYKKVETSDHKFPVVQTWRIIQYIDYDNNQISTSPYISYESEECNYPVLRYNKRKVVIETESDCGDVKLRKECYKGSGWE